MTDNNRIKNNFHRRWLLQLHDEFVSVCQNYGVVLQPPVFEISTSGRELGGWCSDTRTINISEVLITQKSWAITQQVLKHEMAHQYCSEARGETGHSAKGQNPRGHDDLFRYACKVLGVLPEFRGRNVILDSTVDDLVDRSGSSQGLKGKNHLLKVEKLLALGKSPNLNEAERAIEKAQELIAKYNLQQLQSLSDEKYTFIVIDKKRKQITSYQRFICTILQDFFFVQVLLSRLYDPLRDDVYKTIELYGTHENTAVAEYCYHFLENHISRLWTEYRQRLGASYRAHKKSYQIGVARGFYQKLQQGSTLRQNSRQEQMSSTNALVAAEDVRLQSYVTMLCPRVTKRSTSPGKLFTGTYQQGLEAGKNLRFTEGIGGNTSQLPGLLG